MSNTSFICSHTLAERCQICELEKKLADQKAITELAVKGLKMISRYPHYPDDSHSHSLQTVQREAAVTLSEIERLSK